MGFTVSNALALVAVVTCLIVMKVLICSCLMRRRQGRSEDTIPILEDTIERLHEIHQTRIRARRAREPPPTFEDALRNSRPVSYIDTEDQPPPSYDDYLKWNSFSENNFDGPASIHPCDVIIPMDNRRSNSISSSCHSDSTA